MGFPRTKPGPQSQIWFPALVVVVRTCLAESDPGIIEF